MEAKVSFRPLSDWQERDCLYCGEEADSEAVLGKKIAVRSCKHPVCKQYAIEQAQAIHRSLERDKRRH